MEWIGLLSTFILGGGLMAILTIKPQKQKVVAEAKQIEATAEGTEIDNADKVVKMWREYAEASNARYEATILAMSATMSKMEVKMSEMECTVKKLTTTNNQILRILKEINHENQIGRASCRERV